MIEKNQFYRKTNQKKRSLAAAQRVCKDGFRVEFPAHCFRKNNGLMKVNVFRAVTGHWTKEKVQSFVDNFGAVLLSDENVERSV